MKAILKLLVITSLLIPMAAAAHTQLEGPGPYHLAHLHGVFVDAKGNPIQGAAVTLVDRDNKIRSSTTTDRSGRFALKHVSGHYWLRLKSPGYSVVNREVVVGEAVTYLHGATLYMIAGPGACTDDCSSVFTSRRDFEHAIRRNTGHQD
jgi:hypothetical protein